MVKCAFVCALVRVLQLCHMQTMWFLNSKYACTYMWNVLNNAWVLYLIITTSKSANSLLSANVSKPEVSMVLTEGRSKAVK